MNVRVFRHAMRQSARTIAILAVSHGAFIYLVMLAFPSFKGLGRGFFAHPPRYMEAFLGGSADFVSPVGWVASAMGHPISLALLIGAGLTIAAGAVATEVERGSIDLVLARPVGRSRFLVAKAAAAAAAVTVTEIGGFLGGFLAWATIARVDEISLASMARAFGASWVLFVALAMIAVLVSTRNSLRGRAVGIAVGVAVAAFFINFIALLFDEVSGMRFASPFHYFRAADALGGGSVGVDVAVLGGLAVAALALALAAFRRRDLTR